MSQSQPSSQHTQDEPFLGWKVLVAINGNLHSPQQEGIHWKPREPMVAVCYQRAHESRKEGVPPHTYCTCGIYAVKSLEQELSHYVRTAQQTESLSVFPVVAQIALWGRVMQGNIGWRAQFAYPRTLYTNSQPLAEFLSDVYGVPAFSDQWDDIQKEINRFKADKDAGRKTVIVDADIRAKIDAMSLEERLKLFQRVKYQQEYHQWYNRGKQLHKNLVYWEGMVRRAPIELRKVEDEIKKYNVSKPKKPS